MRAELRMPSFRIKIKCIACPANHADIGPIAHNVRHRQTPSNRYNQQLFQPARDSDEYSGPTPKHNGEGKHLMVCSRQAEKGAIYLI